jgi:c-di-GMP-binding flagellar brake protein YcgR
MKTATAQDIAPTPKPRERRRFQRVKVSLLGRYMLESKREFPCQVVDMSPGGLAVVAPVVGRIGEHVIAYIDHIGRVEGRLVRPFDGGFAMTVEATARKRDKLAAQLTWLANRHVLGLAEDRRHERIIPRDPFTQITMADGRVYRCRIIDMSLSGAAVQVEVKPAVGSAISLGRLRARVVRHTEFGIALEFASVQDPDYLERHLH